jgi:hypothetical protein
MQHGRQYEIADPAAISARIFDDEIVIANFTTGIYYSARAAGAEIWLGLMAGVPLDRIAHAVAPHCAAPADVVTHKAAAFVDTLVDEGLVRPAERTTDETWAPRVPAEAFADAVLERYTDMEELLLLDPIHDVGKTGWSDLLRTNPD